jgi:hypothetical protein
MGRRGLVTLNLAQHEPSDACLGEHCYSCGVDEASGHAYRVCFECGHVYPTARALRKAYRRVRWEILRNPGIGGRAWFSNEWQTGTLRQVWTTLTVRASKIYFCQLCIHDF